MAFRFDYYTTLEERMIPIIVWYVVLTTTCCDKMHFFFSSVYIDQFDWVIQPSICNSMMGFEPPAFNTVIQATIFLNVWGKILKFLFISF